MSPQAFPKPVLTTALIFVALISLLTAFRPIPARAQEPPPPRLSLEQARQAALARISMQPAWTQAALGQPTLLYDLSGEVTAYLFPVSQAKLPAGYLTVAALAIPNPVLEFATTGGTPLAGAIAPITTRPLYLGLLHYGYELAATTAGYRRVLTLIDGQAVTVPEAILPPGCSTPTTTTILILLCPPAPRRNTPFSST